METHDLIRLFYDLEQITNVEMKDYRPLPAQGLREGEDGGMGTRFSIHSPERKEVMVQNEPRERNNSNFVASPRTSQH